MANIIGEPTPQYVINQVNKRQQIHGSGVNQLRTNEELNYLNSKTAWVKLVSSVDLTKEILNPTIKDLGLFGSTLAEKYVLFNGVTNESPREGSEETYQRSGVARDGSIDNKSAYGVGGLEFGLSPMMGITSANISSKNRGSLRTAKVEIIANNRTQFEIIETLYIKLGYFMLLEWGWTNYYTSTEYITDNPHSLADPFLLRKFSYDTFLTKIEEERSKSEGNYDALLGKVTNFSWTFEPSGQYKISIDLISQGDVIESLKVNTLLPDDATPAKKVIKNKTSTGTTNKNNTNKKEPSKNKEETETPPTSEEIIKSYMDKSSLGRYLGNQVKNLSKFNSLTYTYPGENKAQTSFVKQKYLGTSSDDKGTTIYYVSLRRLLLWIEENLVPNITKGEGSKFINFDIDVESNLMLNSPVNVSVDPRVCNFNSQWKFGENDKGYSTLYYAEDFTKTVGNNEYGRIMNIYFNIQWVLKTFDELKDRDGDVILFDFIKTLLNAYCNCTGNYNKLTPDIDPDTNTLIIRDETPQPDRKSKVDTAFFNTFGYLPNNTSNFIRNLNFNTTVSPKLATMISVGATRDGYTPGYDATGLQAINFGTFDAIKPELKNNSGQTTTTEGDTKKTTLKNLKTKYKGPIDNFNKYLRNITTKKVQGGRTIPKLDPEAANAYSSTIKDIIEYKQLKETKENFKPFSGSPTVGFIPFDLGLTLDGLSGVKIYNKIAVETSFLPYNYPEALEFVIKGVDHNINNNDWVTNLTTLAIPKNPYGGGKIINDLGSITQRNSAISNTSDIEGKPVTLRKKRVIEKIVKYARSQGINDRERLTAILAVAEAEAGYKSNIQESFNYSVESAKKTFSAARKKTNEELEKLLPRYGKGGSDKKFADYVYGVEPYFSYNLKEANSGYKYSGKGLSQITFKGNYVNVNKVLEKYKTGYDIIKDTSLLLNEDVNIAILVLCKKEGTFGNFLVEGNKEYLSNGVAVEATQNGTNGKGRNHVTSVTKNYTRAIANINATPWIQELIKTS